MAVLVEWAEVPAVSVALAAVVLVAVAPAEVGKMLHEDKIIKCPRCNINMKKVTKKGVTIDVCKKCHGMWLDDGEIDKLVMLGRGVEK